MDIYSAGADTCSCHSVPLTVIVQFNRNQNPSLPNFFFVMVGQIWRDMWPPKTSTGASNCSEDNAGQSRIERNQKRLSSPGSGCRRQEDDHRRADKPTYNCSEPEADPHMTPKLSNRQGK